MSQAQKEILAYSQGGGKRGIETARPVKHPPSFPTVCSLCIPDPQHPPTGSKCLLSLLPLENLSVFLGHSTSHKAIISIFPFLCKSAHAQLAWPAQRPPAPPSPASPGLLCFPPPPLPGLRGSQNRRRCTRPSMKSWICPYTPKDKSVTRGHTPPWR